MPPRSSIWLWMGLLASACGPGAGPQPADGGFEPYRPPPAEQPLVDTVFLQEINHTTNELEPGAGPLVWVGLPPAELAGRYETPTRVGPRGLVYHAAGGGLERQLIPASDPDLIAAAFAPSGLVLAGPRRLYFHGPEGLEPLDAPADLTLSGLAPGGQQVYLLTDRGAGVARGPTQVLWPSDPWPVSAALEAHGRLYLAGADYVSAHDLPAGALPGPAHWRLGEMFGLDCGEVVGLVADVELPRPLDLVLVGQRAIQALSFDTGGPALVPVAEFEAGRVPLDRPRAAARTADGGLLVAAEGGACRLMDRGAGPEWRVYNAERWLPAEQVRAVATDPGRTDGPIWFATAGGLGWVEARRQTLEEKLEAFVERVAERHDRDGAVADSHLLVRGELSSNVPWDSDNDGGWTCYWVLAECFRWRVTGDPQAKAHFDRSLARMLSLRTLTGSDHFLARSVIRKAGCQLDDCDDPDDGEWFSSPDGEWWVKGDTSNDEVTSHMFMMGHAYDLCADEAQRQAIRAHVDGIVGGLVDHGYQLIDLDGQVTSHGRLDPGYCNDPLGGLYADGGRRSAQMLAALDLALYLTDRPKYEAAKRELIEQYHYDQNAVHESEAPFRQGEKSGDGNELATQAFFVLLRYEQDPALRAEWLAGWRNTYAQLAPQQAALWDLVDAAFGDEPRLAEAGRWLRLAPVDMIRWDQHNSQRLDLIPAPAFYADDARMRSDGRILPYDERRCDRWNTDQYRVDGGMGGWVEMDGADVLMPYWLGRYYGFIVPAD